MGGCWGGVSPCAGLGGSPGATQSITKKEKNKMRVPEQLRSSLQWERLVRATPKEAARVSEQATKFARVGNGRFRVLQVRNLIRHALRRGAGMTSSDLATLGHLPQRGRLSHPLRVLSARSANLAALGHLPRRGRLSHPLRVLSACKSPCRSASRQGRKTGEIAGNYSAGFSATATMRPSP